MYVQRERERQSGREREKDNDYTIRRQVQDLKTSDILQCMCYVLFTLVSVPKSPFIGGHLLPKLFSPPFPVPHFLHQFSVFPRISWVDNYVSCILLHPIHNLFDMDKQNKLKKNRTKYILLLISYNILRWSCLQRYHTQY